VTNAGVNRESVQPSVRSGHAETAKREERKPVKIAR
jgi:hypothetical protein